MSKGTFKWHERCGFWGHVEIFNTSVASQSNPGYTSVTSLLYRGKI